MSDNFIEARRIAELKFTSKIRTKKPPQLWIWGCFARHPRWNDWQDDCGRIRSTIRNVVSTQPEICYPAPSSSWLRLLGQAEDSKDTSSIPFCRLSLVLLYNDRWCLRVQPLHKFTSFVTKQKQEDKDGSMQIGMIGNIAQAPHFTQVWGGCCYSRPKERQGFWSHPFRE